MPMLPALLHSQMLADYGPQDWWPAKSEFEMLVGAILVQSTRWSNVERAIGNLRESNLLNPELLLQLPDSVLFEQIRPAGFQSVRSRRLRAAAIWYKHDRPGLDNLQTAPLRARLLAVDGIGPETADVLLMYLFRRPAAIADAYSRRVLCRLGMLEARYAGRYEQARRQMQWMSDLPWDVASELHALLIEHAKRRCRKVPVCQGCALAADCPVFLASPGVSQAGSPNSCH